MKKLSRIDGMDVEIKETITPEDKERVSLEFMKTLTQKMKDGSLNDVRNLDLGINEKEYYIEVTDGLSSYEKIIVGTYVKDIKEVSGDIEKIIEAIQKNKLK